MIANVKKRAFLLIGVALFQVALVQSSSSSLVSLFTEEKSPVASEVVVTDVVEIAKIMDETADFLRKMKKYPSKFVTITPGILGELGVTLDDVLETVEFIAKTGKAHPERLQDADFLNTHFTFYRWHGDATKKTNAIPKGWKKPPESIVTTQYRITEIPASRIKTDIYFYPIYTLPDDEKNLTRKEVLAKKESLTRFLHSRVDILAGSLDKFSVTKVIAWVTDAGRREFGMQGSVLLNFEDGKEKELIRVAGTNGMKNELEYWFADHVKKRKNSKFPVKVKPRPDVSYAGDLDLLGFGKVIMLTCWNPVTKRREIRLGVLVDTGSAFKNNLAKLDMFTGYFPDKKSFQNHIKPYPQTARAHILIRKKNQIPL